MGIPKYIEEKINQRAKLQERANVLQFEIEEWCEKNNIDLWYSASYIVLYTEPEAAASMNIIDIENALASRRGE